jgi:hypothetical protein
MPATIAIRPDTSYPRTGRDESDEYPRPQGQRPPWSGCPPSLNVLPPFDVDHEDAIRPGEQDVDAGSAGARPAPVGQQGPAGVEQVGEDLDDVPFARGSGAAQGLPVAELLQDHSQAGKLPLHAADVRVDCTASRRADATAAVGYVVLVMTECRNLGRSLNRPGKVEPSVTRCPQHSPAAHVVTRRGFAGSAPGRHVSIPAGCDLLRRARVRC